MVWIEFCEGTLGYSILCHWNSYRNEKVIDLFLKKVTCMHFKNSKLGTASSSFYLYGFTVHIKLTKIGHGLITNKSSEYYNYFSRA